MKHGNTDKLPITSLDRLVAGAARFVSRILGKAGSATGKDIHIKILVTVTLSVVLSIVIISAILYLYFENIIIGRIYESEKNNLYQAGVSTKLMRELSRSMAIQMYNDFALSGLFFSTGSDPLDAYTALSNLKKYKDLVPYVHSIYIYNPGNDTYYINSPAKTVMIQKRDSFFDTDIISLLADSFNYNSGIPVPRIVAEPGVSGDSTDEYGVYTFVYNLSGARSSQHAGTIVINISEKWVRDIIDSVDINPVVKTLIIDEHDRLLLGDVKNPMLSAAGVYGYIKQSSGGMGNPGNVVVDLRGAKTLVVYSFEKDVRWVFVKLIPFEYIMADVFEMRKNLLFIAGTILLVGAFCSILFARRLYKPIDDVLDMFLRLEEERKSDTLVLRQHNMKRLLTQSGALSEFELNRFFDRRFVLPVPRGVGQVLRVFRKLFRARTRLARVRNHRHRIRSTCCAI